MPPIKSIALVANTSWSIYKFRLYLIKYLIDKGFSLFVLAPRDAHTVQFEHIPGLTYIELKEFKSKALSPVQDLRLLSELSGHYRNIRPDCIFHYTIKANIWGSIAAARTEIPCVSVVTGLGYAFAGGGWLQTSAKLLYRYALQKNRETWFLNEDDRQVFLRQKLVRPGKSFILPGEGVDTSIFSPVPLPSDKMAQVAPAPPKTPPLQVAPAPSQTPPLQVSPTPSQSSPHPAQPSPGTTAPQPGSPQLTFLLIARIIEHKGIREFIHATRILREKGIAQRCQLLGFFDEGSPISISRTEVSAWQKEGLIEYLGDTDDVAPFIAAADCIVLPSYREGMPLSLLEGASMGRPLVATDVAGCRQLVEEGVNGYRCTKKDGVSLAEKMHQIAALSPESRRKMGDAGRELIMRQFTQEIVADTYLKKIALFLEAPGR